MFAQRHVVSLTTDASGDVTGYAPSSTGRVLGIRYVKTDFDNGVGFTITAEATGQAILTLTNQNSSGSFYPRVPVQDDAGADATLDGTRKMREPVVIVNDRVKIVVASGGNAKTGAVHVLIG